MAKKNIESLYKQIFNIKESLQDAVSVALETSNLAAEFGGEISRVLTSQINDYLIPTISKYIEDPNTPGSVAPLVTFLDSVPLAMTRQEPAADVIAPSAVNPGETQQVQSVPTLPGAAVAESKKTRSIKESQLSSEINKLEQIIWSSGNTKAERIWDNYSDELLADAQYWDNLSTDSLNNAMYKAKSIIDQYNLKRAPLPESKKKLAAINALLEEIEEDILDEDSVKEIADEWGVDEEKAKKALTVEKAKENLEEA